MSVKIRITYTDDRELEEVLRLLSPMVKSAKKRPTKGMFKRAYIELNHGRTTGN